MEFREAKEARTGGSEYLGIGSYAEKELQKSEYSLLESLAED